MKKVIVRSGTLELLAASTRCFLWLLAAVSLNLVPFTTFAATQPVEIGKFTSAGTITLQLPKFHEQFADVVPPFAVINDLQFLESLSRRDRVCGIVEAVKVAALKDAAFFEDIAAHASRIAADSNILARVIRRSAQG